MSDTSIVIYESAFCPYCSWAKRLLDNEGISYTKINIDRDFDNRQEMETRSGRQTVPQIFFEERHIGGYDDLFALKSSGELGQLIDHSLQ